MRQSDKNMSPLTLVLIVGVILFGLSQIAAEYVFYYKSSEIEKYKQSAQVQTIKILRLSQNTEVRKTTRRPSSSKRNRRSGDRVVETESTVYKVQYQYEDHGLQKQGGAVLQQVPFFEEGDSVEAWVNPNNPSGVIIAGVNDQPLSKWFLHLGFAFIAMFFAGGFGTLIFFGSVVGSRLKVVVPSNH